jgi:plastocyanin
MRWRQMVRVCTLVLIAGLVAVIVVLHDKDTVILTVITFVLLLFLPSKRAWLGIIGLAVLFADVAFFTGSAAYSNVKAHEKLTSIAPPAAFAALSVLGAVTALVALVRYRSKAKGTGAPLGLAAVAVVAFAGVLVASLVAGTNGNRPQPGDAVIHAKNTAFSTKTLTARSKAGEVTVFASNADFFWHTFTVDSLHVDLRVPEGGHRRLTFAAKPGRYKFRCAVPGHALAGMKGTLVVR